jgi:DnaK suppressor protein
MISGVYEMTKNDWHEKFRQAMMERRAAIQRVLQSNLKASREDFQPAVEVVERASDDAAGDLAAGLAEIESGELVQINEALRKMEDGTYGQCQGCGKPIPQKRLQIVPFAIRCVECERSRETVRSR